MSLSNTETAAWLMTALTQNTRIRAATNSLGQTFKVGDKVYFPDPKPPKPENSSSRRQAMPLTHEGVIVSFINNFVALVRYADNAWNKDPVYRHAIPVEFLQLRKRSRI